MEQVLFVDSPDKQKPQSLRSLRLCGEQIFFCVRLRKSPVGICCPNLAPFASLHSPRGIPTRPRSSCSSEVLFHRASPLFCAMQLLLTSRASVAGRRFFPVLPQFRRLRAVLLRGGAAERSRGRLWVDALPHQSFPELDHN